jgi:DNA-binding response OmpR family regulator
MNTYSSADMVFEFGHFRLFERGRSLSKNGNPCKIGGREFDLLLALARRPGELVGKTELMHAVWPNTCVEDGNLRSQMCNLRETLGEDAAIIKTVAGRGYVLSVGVKTISTETEIASDVKRGSAIRVHGTCSSKDADTMDNDDVIVVIDDDENVRDSLEQLFLSVGMKTVTFASPRDYVQARSSIPPACFIVDVMMPYQTGLEFLEALRRKHHRTPAIFISGHADVRLSVRAMKAGAIDFLTKPVDCEQLLTAVQSTIRPPPNLKSAVW